MCMHLDMQIGFGKAKVWFWLAALQGKALSLEEVGMICFTELGGNRVSSALGISPFRYLT